MISTDFLTACTDLAGALIQQHWTPNPHATTIADDALFEAQAYYHGLPSNPISLYHTGAPWKRPTGPEAYHVRKEARPICKHPIADVWDKLGPHVPKYLDSVAVKWTTIDVTRFADIGKDPGPVFLWVGVKPGSLSRKNAEVAAIGCKKLLMEFEITDVEVAFRESLFTRSFGPQLLDYVPSFDATAPIRSPLTPALGLPIAAQATPHLEGTGGIYICEGGESKRVFILTARHVVIPSKTGHNELYSHTKVGQPRHNVLLLGTKAFQDVLQSIMCRISHQAHKADHYKDVLEHLGKVGGADNDNVQAQEEWTQKKCKEAEEEIDDLDKLHSEVTKNWSAECQRVLGHIAHSPPISIGIGPTHFTEDWALIELHNEKIDWKNFKGNVIDLGTFSLPH